MTTQRLCCAMLDGTVKILSPAPEMFDPQSRIRHLLAEQGRLSLSATEQDVWAFIQAKDVPKDAVSVRAHDVSELPQDRTFRNAWTHDGLKVSVDMPKARTIHMDRIRRACKPELDRITIEMIAAVASGRTGEAQTFAAQRQTLLDLPQTLPVDQCQTPEDLKAMWPKGLPPLP